MVFSGHGLVWTSPGLAKIWSDHGCAWQWSVLSMFWVFRWFSYGRGWIGLASHDLADVWDGHRLGWASACMALGLIGHVLG